MTFLFAGYTVVWTALFLYLLHLHRRIQAVRRDQARLSGAVADNRPEDRGPFAS